MQLVLDASFPVQAEVYGGLDFSLVRWSLESFDDLDLLRATAEAGFDGVIMLGAGSLSPELVAAAAELKLYVAATYDANPAAAIRALASNLSAIKRRVAAGSVDLIYAREVKRLARWWEV